MSLVFNCQLARPSRYFAYFLTEMASGKQKADRSKNWQPAEISLLQELVEEHEDILKSKQTNALTNQRKNKKWLEITEQINALGLTQRRTADKVKTKWGNMQQSAKKVYTDVRKQRKLTGGGPAPKAPTAEEEKIINMMKDRPNFSGIVGGFESSMPLESMLIITSNLATHMNSKQKTPHTV